MARLDQLPAELTAQIATGCDAVSVLCLSATCRRLRDAVFNSPVFRSIIIKSQRDLWDQDRLDIDAIARRCDGDPSVWARYAIADHKAYVVSQDADTRGAHYGRLIWAPELFLVKHPFMYSPCWRWPDIVRGRGQERWEWASALSLLARQEQNQIDERYHAMLTCKAVVGDVDPRTFFQALLWTIAALGRNIPPLPLTNQPLHTTAASVNCVRFPPPRPWAPSYFAVPRLSELNLCASGPLKALAAPLAAVVNDNWEAWIAQHSQALVDEITDGTWHGYYVYFSQRNARLPPHVDRPMTGIKFHRESVPSDPGGNSIKITAENCRDGVGIFSVSGSITCHGEDAFVLSARKDYRTSLDGTAMDFGWDWSLKLTSFGLVGFWGSAEGDPNFERLGSVWLWKEN